MIDRRTLRQSDPNSLASRICAFFSNNPDEMLTYSDIAVKFDCTVEQARNAVNDLRKRKKGVDTSHIVHRAGQ